MKKVRSTPLLSEPRPAGSGRPTHSKSPNDVAPLRSRLGNTRRKPLPAGHGSEWSAAA